jgi:RND family efflux transporter MFP subunit
LLVLLGCDRAPPPETSPEPTVIAPENAVAVERKVIQSGPRIAGSLEAKETANVRAEIGGSVLGVKTEVGDRVRQGQLLARIEQKTLRQQLASARSALRSAEEEREVAERQAARARRLVEVGAMSERDRELAASEAAAARARVAEAAAAVAAAEEQLSTTIVRSPIDGVVSERAVSEGDVVAAGALLFTVIDPSSMRLVASVPSSELTALEVGTEVRFEVVGYEEKTFSGTIERIAPAVDPSTRQIDVYVSIPNVRGELIAGLFAEGRVAARAHEGLIVPLSAVDLEGVRPTVVKIENGVARRVPVELGIRDDQREEVELTSGVKEGDLVLLGSARVAPGTEVEVQPLPDQT